MEKLGGVGHRDEESGGEVGGLKDLRVREEENAERGEGFGEEGHD